MELLTSYLGDGTLLQDPKEDNHIKKRSERFLLYEGLLYKKAFSHLLLRCTTLEKDKRILDKMHKEKCGSHIKGHSLAAKTLKTGYYWLTLQLDAIEMVRKCDKCP